MSGCLTLTPEISLCDSGPNTFRFGLPCPAHSSPHFHQIFYSPLSSAMSDAGPVSRSRTCVDAPLAEEVIFGELASPDQLTDHVHLRHHSPTLTADRLPETCNQFVNQATSIAMCVKAQRLRDLPPYKTCGPLLLCYQAHHHQTINS